MIPTEIFVKKSHGLGTLCKATGLQFYTRAKGGHAVRLVGAEGNCSCCSSGEEGHKLENPGLSGLILWAGSVSVIFHWCRWGSGQRCGAQGRGRSGHWQTKSIASFWVPDCSKRRGPALSTSPHQPPRWSPPCPQGQAKLRAQWFTGGCDNCAAHSVSSEKASAPSTSRRALTKNTTSPGDKITEQTMLLVHHTHVPLVSY
jgi:hypothetical protein